MATLWREQDLGQELLFDWSTAVTTVPRETIERHLKTDLARCEMELQQETGLRRCKVYLCQLEFLNRAIESIRKGIKPPPMRFSL